MFPRRLAASCVVLAAVASCLAAPASPASGRSIYIDGDSIAYGTDLFLPRFLRGWAIRSAVDVSRHTYQGVASIEALEQEHGLPYVVLVNLGTNDDPRAVREFRSYVARVVRAAGPERCVIWATIVRPPYAGVSYDGLNEVLLRTAARTRGFHVFDWRALARGHRSWFGSDGVHPSMQGYLVRARQLASFVRASC